LSRYYFFQVAPQIVHEAEWTPFQTAAQKNLATPGIEPGTVEPVNEIKLIPVF
jgi:hypothetical protein